MTMNPPFVRIGISIFALALSVLPLPGTLRAENRDIRVKILADEEWRRDPGWAQKAAETLKAVSADFERLFEIRLLPEKLAGWDSDDAIASLEALVEDLEARVDKEGCEVLLALTAQNNLSRDLSAFSLFKEAVVLIRPADSPALLVRTLKHEIGHLFGAVHVPNPDSVMDVYVQGDDFDVLNREAIRLNRARFFNSVEFPVLKAVRPRAIELYTRICEVIESAELQKKLGWTERTGVRTFIGDGGRHDSFELDDAFLLLAQIDIEEKQYEDAARACRAGLKIQPDNPEAQNLLGIIDRKQGHVEEAIQKYRDILRVKPRHAWVLYNLGIAYGKKGDFEAARAAYEKAVEVRPHSAETHNNLGETLLRLGDIDEAEKELSKAVSLCPGFSLAYANLADLSLKRGDLDRARVLLQRARELNPEVPSLWNVLGNLAHKEGRPAEAVQHYLQALALDPDFDKGYFNLGISYFDLNEIGLAKENFKKAIAVNPNLAEAHASLGYCLIKEGQIDGAVAEIHVAQQLGLRSAATHLNLSFAYIQAKRIDEAIQEAELAIRLDPSLPMAYNNLGIAYAKKGKLEEAAAQFEKSIRADASYREAWVNGGNLYYLAGKLDLALDRFLAAFKLAPKDGPLCNNIAVVYFRKGEYAQAWAYAEKARLAGFKVDPGFLSELKKKLSGRGGI
jgi:tetratricopeptide (TPR) repeat protein